MNIWSELRLSKEKILLNTSVKIVDYFNDMKSKKSIWKTVFEMGIEKSSLSTFYSHKDFLTTEKYICNFIQIQNIPKITAI